MRLIAVRLFLSVSIYDDDADECHKNTKEHGNSVVRGYTRAPGKVHRHTEHAYRNKYETQKLLHYAEIKTPDSRHSSMPQHPRREPLRVQNPLFDILLPDGQHLLPRVSLNRK